MNKPIQITSTTGQEIQRQQQAYYNQQTTKQASASSLSEITVARGEDCVICLDTIIQPMQLDCKHVYYKSCIEEHLKHQPKCPTCGKLFGTPKGNQPEGKMESKEIKSDLPGYRGYGTIVVTYNIHSGIQQVKRITRTHLTMSISNY